MKRLIILLLFCPLSLGAQINESDTFKLKADLALTGVLQDGNVQTVIFRAKSELIYKPWKKWVFKTRNSYVYQEFGQTKADEDILSLNFLYFDPERKVYPLLIGIASTNFRREIRVRSLLGGGVTFQVLNEKEHWLKISLSGEYEQTDFKQTRFNRSEYNLRSVLLYPTTFRRNHFLPEYKCLVQR